MTTVQGTDGTTRNREVWWYNLRTEEHKDQVRSTRENRNFTYFNNIIYFFVVYIWSCSTLKRKKNGVAHIKHDER